MSMLLLLLADPSIEAFHGGMARKSQCPGPPERALHPGGSQLAGSSRPSRAVVRRRLSVEQAVDIVNDSPLGNWASHRRSMSGPRN